MMSPLPTLIFCHGAWHTPEYWTPVRQILEGKGYKCIAPDIIYNGRTGDEPVKSFPLVIKALQEVIAAETALGHDVAMVNHSMGGMAGTSAIQGFTHKDPSKLKSGKSGHVMGLVQLTTWTPVSKEVSLIDMSQEYARRRSIAPRQGLSRPNESTGWADLQGDPAQHFYNDLPPEEGQKWASKLIEFSAAMSGARESVYPGWQDVPMWYLICTEDKAIARELQEYLVQRCREAGGAVTTRHCDAGHSPMLSQPENTATFIEDAVAAFGKEGRQ
jgi:pimeloyl-ACP methyl ester carboxylesterase